MTGKQLKALRRKLRLTQVALAEKTGVNKDTICCYESTKRDLSGLNMQNHDTLKTFFEGEGEHVF